MKIQRLIILIISILVISIILSIYLGNALIFQSSALLIQIIILIDIYHTNKVIKRLNKILEDQKNTEKKK